MLDDHYPSVDISFIIEQIQLCTKVEKVIPIRNTTAYIVAGNRPIHLRTTLIRDTGNGQVGYYFATGTALNLNFMPQLLDWLEKNRKWKDGAYFA
jgi:hypothetical protein